MDYGKWKYEAAQQAKESRRKSTNISIKEMKYRPKIGAGDFETKTRRVEKFLAEGHKVKITIMFRGREMQHPELGKRILDNVAERVAASARVEVMPKLDGRNMTMVLAPDRRKPPVPRREPGAPVAAAPNGTDPVPGAAPPTEPAATTSDAAEAAKPVEAPTTESPPEATVSPA
jgi:translation initiation factor IF-3